MAGHRRSAVGPCGTGAGRSAWPPLSRAAPGGTGDLPGAIEAHEAALARNPSLAQAHANLISLYGRTAQWAQAEAHYKALLAIGYNVDEAHYNYGVLLGLQRRWPEAAAAFRAAIDANPLHAMARNNLGTDS